MRACSRLGSTLRRPFNRAVKKLIKVSRLKRPSAPSARLEKALPGACRCRNLSSTIGDSYVRELWQVRAAMYCLDLERSCALYMFSGSISRISGERFHVFAFPLGRSVHVVDSNPCPAEIHFGKFFSPNTDERFQKKDIRRITLFKRKPIRTRLPRTEPPTVHKCCGIPYSGETALSKVLRRVISSPP